MSGELNQAPSVKVGDIYEREEDNTIHQVRITQVKETKFSFCAKDSSPKYITVVDYVDMTAVLGPEMIVHSTTLNQFLTLYTPVVAAL